KGDSEATMEVFKSIYTSEEAEKEIQEIKSNLALTTSNEGLFQKKYSKILWLGFFIAFFNQLSGINFVLYYAPEILEPAGLEGKE
ncbi:MFS transporter, partial [Flagellimonas flava]|uniref:MFS transporter n=1 Tax=Flagellimonas flava TaxID=570519 RepID=UPI003D657720